MRWIDKWITYLADKFGLPGVVVGVSLGLLVVVVLAVLIKWLGIDAAGAVDVLLGWLPRRS